MFTSLWVTSVSATNARESMTKRIGRLMTFVCSMKSDAHSHHQTSRVVLAMYTIIAMLPALWLPYLLDQTLLSNSRRTSGSVGRNSGRSRIVAAPRLLFKNTSTWTCLATRFRWQVHDKQSRTSSNLLHQQRGQNLLDQRYQLTVSLRIASLAGTGINKRCSRIVAVLE